MLKAIAKTLKDIREKTPLIQCITNYVTINDCANILLCFGASPAMCEAKEEAAQFAEIISGLYINIGTLTEEQKEASFLAARKATELNKPIILDPVACGAIKRKMEVAKELLESSRVSVIKGNVGEIKFLAGFEGKVRGVDSVDDGDGAIEASKSLAKKYNTVVAATGKTDIITDGERVCLIENGTEMLTLITGAGCMTGALTAAAASVGEDKFITTAAAIMAMGIAGELAAKEIGRPLPGTFKVKLLDSIYNTTEEDILKWGKIRCL